MNVAQFKTSQTDRLIAQALGQKPRGVVDGKVHLPDCFIVTTHSPDKNWQPTPEPITCSFCIEVRAGRR